MPMEKVKTLTSMIFAWAKKEEYNPLANPAQYEGDTLKLVYALMLLQPLILSGQVLFVPDPADFDPKQNILKLNLAMKRKDAPIYKEMVAEEKDRMKKISFILLGMRTEYDFKNLKKKLSFENKNSKRKLAA